MTFDQLLVHSDHEWQRIRQHPFVTALGKGDLSLEKFRYFIGQDRVYLKDFSKVLATLAALAPDSTAARTMLRHADTVFSVEQSLHDSVGEQMGLRAMDLQDVEADFVTKAYQDHLVRTVGEGSFITGLAAVLPCYWTYSALGRELSQNGKPGNALFVEWIDTYAAEQYRRSVEEVGALWESYSGDLPDTHTLEVYDWSMTYERLFWEQAWQLGLKLD
ncbi:MAG: thiaminase II [Firmicutes bacterium]|nr:thiaminase II [Bacillota bacterium]